MAVPDLPGAGSPETIPERGDRGTMDEGQGRARGADVSAADASGADKLVTMSLSQVDQGTLEEFEVRTWRRD
jgi:hypothetical protein